MTRYAAPASGDETVVASGLALTLHWNTGGLEGIDMRWRSGAEPTPELSGLARDVARQLAGYVRGEPPCWPDLPLCWDGLSAFARDVLGALRKVPFGSVVGYGQLARMAGRPGAARAVGGALGRNPWPLIVPCHRVVGAGGGLTGFTNPSGVGLKAHLLKIEGIDLVGGKVRMMR